MLTRTHQRFGDTTITIVGSTTLQNDPSYSAHYGRLIRWPVMTNNYRLVSAIAKCNEFLRLDYPIGILRYMCAIMARETANPTWMTVRRELIATRTTVANRWSSEAVGASRAVSVLPQPRRGRRGRDWLEEALKARSRGFTTAVCS